MKVLRKLGRKLTRFFSARRPAYAPDARLSSPPVFRDGNPSVTAAGLMPAILLPTSGRNGSTLTMQLLATSPQIAMEREYPYEARYFTFFLKMSQLPLLTPSADGMWSSETLLRPDGKTIFGPPTWPGRTLTLGTPHDSPFDERCFLALWREFSAAAGYVANASEFGMTDGTGVLWYAEKTSWKSLAGFRGSIATRCLYLLRDPRDVWISVRKFDAQRGYFGFGRRIDESEADFLGRFLEQQVETLEHLQGLREDDRTMIVRYERLAGDMPTESRRIGDWLGLTLDPQAVEGNRRSFAHHMTSDGKAASVARWKRELPPEINRRFVDRLGDLLRHFDYETT